MSKIWKVEVMYSDYESSQFITIGLFTDKEKAEEVKVKWETFHNTYSESLLVEPDGWDPTIDEWYSDNDKYNFEWKDSRQYQTLSMKYGKLNEFDEIIITEFELDKDIFKSQISNNSVNFKQIVKEFERDYNLNNLLK